jgi:hypothetical protein
MSPRWLPCDCSVEAEHIQCMARPTRMTGCPWHIDSSKVHLSGTHSGGEHHATSEIGLLQATHPDAVSSLLPSGYLPGDNVYRVPDVDDRRRPAFREGLETSCESPNRGWEIQKKTRPKRNSIWQSWLSGASGPRASGFWSWFSGSSRPSASTIWSWPLVQRKQMARECDSHFLKLNAVKGAVAVTTKQYSECSVSRQAAVHSWLLQPAARMMSSISCALFNICVASGGARKR